jgi:hypothetical protein
MAGLPTAQQAHPAHLLPQGSLSNSILAFHAHQQPLQHSAPRAERKPFLWAAPARSGHLGARRQPTSVATSTLTPGPIVELIAARFM